MGKLTKKEKEAKANDDESLFKYQNFRHHMLRFFRERKVKMTRPELAKEVGVTPFTVYQWETPDEKLMPGRDMMRKLCDVFQCDVVELYTDFDNKSLDTALDDMIEVILADFHQNIRSDSVGKKSLALKELELLSEIRKEQEIRAAREEQSPESAAVQDTIRDMIFGPPPEDDDDTEEINGDPEK